jgi:hypothetical protein
MSRLIIIQLRSTDRGIEKPNLLGIGASAADCDGPVAIQVLFLAPQKR